MMERSIVTSIINTDSTFYKQRVNAIYIFAVNVAKNENTCLDEYLYPFV